MVMAVVKVLAVFFVTIAEWKRMGVERAEEDRWLGFVGIETGKLTL